MIGKVSVPRGRRCEPLVRYLYGAGRANEHQDPHIVAAWRSDHRQLEPGIRPDGRRDFRRLTGMLRAANEALVRPYERPVWHCSVRAAPGDRELTDGEWAAIARDIMDRTGLHRTGEDDRAVRWIAVRHAPDHVHLVVLLARQDGTKPVLRGDFFQVGAACRAAEDRFGLTVTAPRDRTAARRPGRAETEKTARQGRRVPARVTLQQLAAEAAAAAASEAQYFAWLENAGVLVRRRYSTRDPGQVTGYAVSLPGDTGTGGQPVWYGGGRLAADLTLPRLRARWPAAGSPGPAGPRGGPLTPDERTAIWEHAARTAAAAAGAIRTDPGSAADIAWAAAGFLHGAAAATGSPYLRQAARAYDRAARPRYARIPAPSPAGTALRAAARTLSAVAATAGDKGTRDAMKTMALVIEIVALIEVIAASRQAARLAAQAAAAREAARFAAAARVPGHAPYQPGRARQAVLDFPQGPVTSGQGPRRDTAPPPARRPRPGPRPPGRGR